MIGLRIAQGLLCAVEVCGLYFLIQLFFERRWDSSFSKILWMISGAVLYGLIIYQKDQVSMYSRYFMLVCIVLSAFLTKFCVDISLAKAVLISALYFESICFFDIFLSFIGQALYSRNDFFEYIQYEMSIKRILLMAVSRIFLGVSVYLLMKYRLLVQRIFSKYILIFAGYAVLEYFGLLFCDQVFIPAFGFHEKIYIYFALYPLIITLTLIVIILYIIFIERKNEIRLVNSQNKMLEKNYHEMIMLYHNRDRIFRNMKSDLTSLSTLIAEQDLNKIEEYIDKLNEPIMEMEHKDFTGNAIVDTILNDKAEKAKASDISLNIKTKEIKKNKIQDIDWCAILANILDGAIEACCRVKEKKRLIDLCIMQNDCTTFIELSYTYENKNSIRNDKLPGNKGMESDLDDNKMKSVRRAVEKYNGIFDYVWKDGIFTINMSLFY